MRPGETAQERADRAKEALDQRQRTQRAREANDAEVANAIDYIEFRDTPVFQRHDGPSENPSSGKTLAMISDEELGPRIDPYTRKKYGGEIISHEDDGQIIKVGGATVMRTSDHPEVRKARQS